jgi:hypothetical protein
MQIATSNVNDSTPLPDRIQAIEEAYEYMLAYAAQGRRGDDEGQGSTIRDYLRRMDEALLDIDRAALEWAAQSPAGQSAYSDFVKVLAEDAGKARAAIRIVLAQRVISSQLIDNVNASIHLRALLTDLFLIDEALGKTRT